LPSGFVRGRGKAPLEKNGATEELVDWFEWDPYEILFYII